MRTAPKRSHPRRTIRERAVADAEEIFRNYQVNEYDRIRIRTVTHREHLANTNASRVMSLVGPSPLLDNHWRGVTRESYVTAFLERLLTLIDEADHAS